MLFSWFSLRVAFNQGYFLLLQSVLLAVFAGYRLSFGYAVFAAFADEWCDCGSVLV